MAQARVLVIDDSQAMRRSVIYALQRIEGTLCLEAQDGAEGLKKLAAERFDLIITDINMPVMDGLKLIAHVRKDKVHQAVPVVVITTETAEVDRQRALALGANAYLVKPIRANAVIETVRELLKLS